MNEEGKMLNATEISSVMSAQQATDFINCLRQTKWYITGEDECLILAVQISLYRSGVINDYLFPMTLDTATDIIIELDARSNASIAV
jgi:hypothetical protein